MKLYVKISNVKKFDKNHSLVKKTSSISGSERSNSDWKCCTCKKNNTNSYKQQQRI